MSEDRSRAKKQAILSAATELFIARGYDGVSVDAIVQQVGGSKTNIYNYFGGKEGLFRAMVENLCQQLLLPLNQAEIENLPPQEALTNFGHRLTAVVLSEQAIALHRVIVAQTQQFPELGQLFFTTGPKALCQRLVSYLNQQRQMGTLEILDPEVAARQFVGMLLGLIHVQRILGIIPPPTDEERTAIVEGAVATFLKAYGCH